MNLAALSTPSVRVHLLPEFVPLQDLAGRTVVIVDVLRASTTLVAALEAGCHSIVPCLEVSEARQLGRDRAARAPVLLGGERGGVPIAGFDLGNSPLEYTPDRVAGRQIVFTTTNGTRAMMRAVGAQRVLIGAFVNRQAVAEALVTASDGVDILCAGTDGQVSWEDSLFAGALLEQLENRGFTAGNDSAELVRLAWRNLGDVGRTSAGLAQALRTGAGGRNVLRIGREDDIDWAAQLDAFHTVPELFMADWTIRQTGVDCDPGPRVN